MFLSYNNDLIFSWKRVNSVSPLCVTQRQFLSGERVFPLQTSCLTKVKEANLPYYFP